MKTYSKIYLLTLLIIFGSISNVCAEKRYETESAIIEYDISGNITGSEIAYIKDFGEIESRFSEYVIQMTGNERKQNRMLLREGDNVINADLDKRISIKIDINKQMTPGLNIRLTAKEMADYSEEGLKKMRAVFIGKENVAGKVCKLYQLPFLESKVWVYKNIALKYQSTTKGFRVTYRAVSIQEGVDIAEEKLKLPAGIMNVGTLQENNVMGSIQSTL